MNDNTALFGIVAVIFITLGAVLIFAPTTQQTSSEGSSNVFSFDKARADCANGYITGQICELYDD